MSTAKQRDSSKERFWRRVVRQWRKSGLSARAFCRRQDLSEPSFYSWRRTLAQRDAKAARFVSASFVPVRVVAQPAADTVPEADISATGLELVLEDGRRLRIGTGFDATTLRRLLALLQEGRLCC